MKPEESLTPREIRLVLEISTGDKYKAIAQRLGICEGTVRNTVRQIFEKVGVDNKLQLALWWVDHGRALYFPAGLPADGVRGEASEGWQNP